MASAGIFISACRIGRQESLFPGAFCRKQKQNPDQFMIRVLLGAREET